MSKFGINVPEGAAAQSLSDVVKAAESMKDDKGEVSDQSQSADPVSLDRPAPLGAEQSSIQCRGFSQFQMCSKPHAAKVAMCTSARSHFYDEAFQRSRTAQVVLKSQIYAGGRGLGTFKNGLKGGVHICKASDVEGLAKQMLNQTLVTKQTGPAGVHAAPRRVCILAPQMERSSCCALFQPLCCYEWLALALRYA